MVELCLFQFVVCTCIYDLFLIFYTGRDIFVNKNTGHTVTDENLIPKEEREGIKDSSFNLLYCRSLFIHEDRYTIFLKVQEAPSVDFEDLFLFF